MIETLSALDTWLAKSIPYRPPSWGQGRNYKSQIHMKALLRSSLLPTGVQILLKYFCSVLVEKNMTANLKSKPKASQFELLLDVLCLLSKWRITFPRFLWNCTLYTVSQFYFHLLTALLILCLKLPHLKILIFTGSPHIWKASLQNAVGNVPWETYCVWMISHRFHMWKACPLCVLQHNSMLQTVTKMQTVLESNFFSSTEQEDDQCYTAYKSLYVCYVHTYIFFHCC